MEPWDVALERASLEWDSSLASIEGVPTGRPTDISEVPPRRCKSATSLRPRSACLGTQWRKSPSTLTVGGVMFPSRHVLRSGAIAPQKPAVLWAGKAEGPEPDGKIDLDAVLRPAMRRCQEDRVMRQQYRTAALVGIDSSLAWTRMGPFNVKYGEGLPCGAKDEARLEVSPDLTTDTTFVVAALRAHNEVRAKHGVPPLQWSEILAGRARMYADEVCSGETPPETVNLCRRKGDSATESVFNAVAAWYTEGSPFDASSYDAGAKRLTPATFAHALLLWKTTTHVGVNIDESGRVIAAVYYPPANKHGPFAANVLPSLNKPQHLSFEESSVELSKASGEIPSAESVKIEEASRKYRPPLRFAQSRADRRVRCNLNGAAKKFPPPKELPRYPAIPLQDLWTLKGM